MTLENETITEVPVRKGLRKFFRVYKSYAYISLFIAIVFAVLGFLELVNIADIVTGIVSLQLALLFFIVSLVLRIYHKLFEEHYDKKK